MATEYWWADEPKRIAEDLIPKNHDHLIEFTDQIRYVFRDKAAKSNGKQVWGKARKVSGLNAFIAGGPGEFHLVEFAADIWDRLSPRSKRALVDHELCHLNVEEEEKDGELVTVLTIKAHDIEEFTEIVQRHGFWRPDLIDFVSGNAEQLRLSFEVTEQVQSLNEMSDDDIGSKMLDLAKSGELGDILPKNAGIESVTISSGGRSVTIDRDSGL